MSLKSKPPVRAVFFDCDGTLIDTVPMVVGTKQHALRMIGRKLPPVEDLISTIGLPIDEDIKAYNLGDDADRYFKYYRAFQKEIGDRQLGVFVEAYYMLQALWVRGIKLGMVTSRRRVSTLHLLEMFDLDKYFSVMVNPGDTVRSKPFGDPLLEAMHRLNKGGMLEKDLRPEECVYIGDAHHDIECANDAGMRAVLVEWTRMPQSVLKGLDFETTLSNHKQLLQDLELY